MSVHTPSATLTSAPDAEFMMRLQGKTISVVKQGQATVVTLTFDTIGAGGSAARTAIAQPGGGSPIAMPTGQVWSF